MWRKFRGHAQYGANTASVNEMGGMGRGRGGGSGFGGITPMMKRPRLDGPSNMMGQQQFQPPQPGGGYGAPQMNQQFGQPQQNRFPPPPQQNQGPYGAYGR